jgi:hypothetical protein
VRATRPHPTAGTGVAGSTVLDARGQRVGRARGVLPSAGGGPDWAVVATGLLGWHERLVPLTGSLRASRDEEGVRLPWERDVITTAPVPQDRACLTGHDEARLRRHYGLT